MEQLAIDRVKNAVNLCANKAMGMFNVPLHAIEVTFRSKGLAGATAWAKGGRIGIEFNSQTIQTPEGIEQAINVIVPHEVAHLVCFIRPSLGKDHNAGWKRVCLSLGGTGRRTEKMNLKRKRKTKAFVYQVGGERVHLGAIRHNKLQSAKNGYRLANGSQILPTHWTGEQVILE